MEHISRNGAGKKRRFWSWRLFFLLLGVAGVVWFSIPAAWGVYNIGGILGFGFSLCCVVGALALPYIRRRFAPQTRRRVRTAFTVLMVLGFSWAAFLSGCMAYGALQGPVEGEAYTVIVLGSKVHGTSPSADLWQRILAAEEYLKAHPEAKAVASGGQGPGEDISEAKAIRDALVERGIEEERVFLEDRSTNTRENIAFSMELIREKGLSEKVALVTDEYHEFRAARTAAAQGVEAKAVCAHTPWYIFSGCWARELLALSKFFVFG